jgi:4-hydroxybutyrate CoA-transferase
MSAADSWPEELRGRAAAAAAAVRLVESGQRIAVGASNAEPKALVAALLERLEGLREVEALLWPGGFPTPLADPALLGHLRLRLGVPNAHSREALQSGQAVYAPAHQHRTLARLAAGSPPLDGALVMLGPPDAAGYCSFGVSAVSLKPACEAARYVVAEINEQMPRPRGDAAIHCSRIDAAVPVSVPLPELPRSQPGEVERAIGDHVAAIVPDGATIECGIGSLPDAVLAALAGHRGLAIRSGIIGDGVLALAAAGALREPAAGTAPIAAGSVLGSSELYEFVDDSDLVEIHDGLWTHDTLAMAACEKFFAINSAIEIDLGGQVNAEVAKGRVVAGIGGQSDFIRGARLSPGGASILVMSATAAGGSRSRIVPELPPGAPVSLVRADVEWVVTEHGAVNLEGLTLAERATALRSIAAPEHRGSPS